MHVTSVFDLDNSTFSVLLTRYDGGNQHRKRAKGTESVAGSPQGVVLILNLSRTRVSSEHAEFADVVERSSV